LASINAALWTRRGPGCRREEIDHVSRRRKVKIAFVTAGIVLVTMAVAAIPVASADTCTVTYSLPTGGTQTITVSAAPGTPPASLVPPGATLVSASCTPTTTTTTTLVPTV